MSLSGPRFWAALAFSCFASLPLQNLNTSASTVGLFINTAVEWTSLKGDSPQEFATAVEPITGSTRIVGLYPNAELAIVSSYFDYDPKTRTFEFAPSEGLVVYLGKWQRTEGQQLKVEYRFAYGEMLVGPAGCKTKDECDAARYKEPVTHAIWSEARQADGTISFSESPSNGVASPRHYVAVTKLGGLQDLIGTIQIAKKEFSRHQKSSPKL